PESLDPHLESVRAVVADAAIGADEIARRTGLPAGEVAAAVVELELLGLLVQADGLYREVMRSGT
ncbi:MAG: hypothetical protein ACRDM1_00035, partial [Gaiellaceae bacterium]